MRLYGVITQKITF